MTSSTTSSANAIIIISYESPSGHLSSSQSDTDSMQTAAVARSICLTGYLPILIITYSIQTAHTIASPVTFVIRCLMISVARWMPTLPRSSVRDVRSDTTSFCRGEGRELQSVVAQSPHVALWYMSWAILRIKL